MKQILLAGDWHGNAWHAKRIIDAAVERRIYVILQLGDFGYWPHHSDAWLDDVDEYARLNGVYIFWIDGNHENHEMLRQIPPESDGSVQIRPMITYLPRGHRWEWEGVTFLALGGAYSIDKDGRIPGDSWWPEELITYREAYEAIAGGPVAVMVTHDAPWGAENVIHGNRFNKDWFPESKQNRVILRAVMEETMPELVVHGHYHNRNSTTIDYSGGQTRVEGFDCDEPHGKGFIDSFGVLSLPDLTVLAGDL